MCKIPLYNGVYRFMQTYNYMKLRSMLINLIMAFVMLIAGACMLASILKEMILLYNESSRNTYIAAITIIALLIVAGLVLMVVSFRFERFTFGRKLTGYRELKKDLETGKYIAGYNLILTDKYLISYSTRLFKKLSVVKTGDIIACYEEVIAGKDDKADETSIMIVDNAFKFYHITLSDEQTEMGHQLVEGLCRTMPWIFTSSKEAFLDKMSTKKGRKSLLREIHVRKEDMLSVNEPLIEADDSQEVES